MAEDKVEQREFNVRQMLPWTELFRSFQVALDPKKLLLAAAGILAMSLGWWVLAWAFYGIQSKPDWKDPSYDPSNFLSKANGVESAATQLAWDKFKDDRDKWNLLHRTAGDPDAVEYDDAGDLATTPSDFEAVRKEAEQKDSPLGTALREMKEKDEDVKRGVMIAGTARDVHRKPAGMLRTLPWFETRTQNPYLLVTGQAGIPRESGSFGEWFVFREMPVLLEPLVKFLTPVVFLLKPGRTGAYNSFYFLIVIVWTLAVWALFGGAITRMASVQVARNEKISMRESLKFVWARYVSFLAAPLFPLVFVAFMVVLLSIYGVVFMIPWVGDILVAGVGWPLVILAGIIMTVVLIGLVGWPMMYATISAEGSDSFDAISRSYSYVYQSPWSYAWYSLVSIAYGAVVVFFVGFVGSMIVYLGKWGVAQTPFIEKADREPSFLFVYAPTSFGWRTLLLEGARVGGQPVVEHGVINEQAYRRYTGADPDYHDKDEMTWGNRAGAFLVSIWLYLFFLMILGFGYSYFWSASTIIYLLMRRKVDDTDMDEIYLEEDDTEEPYAAATGTAPLTPTTPPAGGTVTMVESPTLRTGITPATPPSPPPTPPTPPRTEETSAAAASDGSSKPAEGGSSS
jgi:hypothetical protein